MANTETLIIGKQEYVVEIREIKQSDLRFYPENPRVYSVLNLTGCDPTQEEIEKHMCGMDHVKQLKVSIESNGGLIDPLIVRDGDFTVLEGNSRLAAYRLLCLNDSIRWGMVKCKVLPADISDSAVFALLGQYHIIGRRDWEPFEQAHYLYRRHLQTKIPIAFMAQELGVPKQKAERMIQVITFMIEHDDLNKRHWSYYEEYLKNAGIKKYRATDDKIDDTISVAIRSEIIHEAADIRKLGQIASVGDKQSKKVMQQIVDGDLDIYEGYEIVEESGKLDDAVKKLKKFRKVVSDTTFEKQISASDEAKNQALFEINKIVKRLNSIAAKLG